MQESREFPGGVAWRNEFRDHSLFVLWCVKWRTVVVFSVIEVFERVLLQSGEMTENVLVK